jgi:hypothetical protein
LCRGAERRLGHFVGGFLLFADGMAQRDHAWISQLSQRLIEGINEKVEHVVRNGDPSGYPGCVNLSFAYVEGESLLMALKVSESAMLMSIRWSNALAGYRVVFRQRMHLGIVGTFVCPSCIRSVNAFLCIYFTEMLTSCCRRC